MSSAPSGRDPLPGRSVVRRTWWVRWWAPLLQASVLAGTLVAGSAAVDSQRGQIAADIAADLGSGARVPVVAPVRRRAAPTVVEVPRLGIRSSLVDLHRTPRGALEVPADPARAGWYVGSSHPGDPGPTVIAGHVDSYEGPGVFFQLDKLHRGDRIVVRRADRSAAVFVVQRVLTVPKRAFPTALVYKGDGRAALRLITCGGSFDRGSKHYRDNVVVLAVPAAKVVPQAQRRPLRAQA